MFDCFLVFQLLNKTEKLFVISLVIMIFPPSFLFLSVFQTTSDVPLAQSPQPGPSGLGRAVSATLSDDGQSYSVRLQANSSGTTSVTPSGTPSDEEDVAVVQVVRPASPEIITLSDSDEEEPKEESEVTAASSSSSRGKALKRRLISSNAASKHRSRKDKSLKKMHKKRSRSSRTSRQLIEQPNQLDLSDCTSIVCFI